MGPADLDDFLEDYTGGEHGLKRDHLSARGLGVLGVIATQRGDQPLLSYLVEHCGAPPDFVWMPESVGVTPLIAGCRVGADHCIRYLLGRVGADHVNHKTSGSQLTALGDAAKTGHADTLALLISHRADVDVRRSNGQTPLMQAAARGSVECARVLIDAGAAVYVVDDAGSSAADLALANGHIDKELLELLGCGRRPGSAAARGMGPSVVEPSSNGRGGFFAEAFGWAKDMRGCWVCGLAPRQ